MSKGERPDWVPDANNEAFTTYVMPGVSDPHHDGLPRVETPGPAEGVFAPVAPATPARKLAAQDYIDGILSGNRTMLARAITLIESNSDRHLDLAQEVLAGVMHKSGNSIRLGITGVPGVGKSTFIESFGTYLCDENNRVAVLAVDPTSSLSGGSILGDKTRMEQLSRHPNSFIRPSPSGGALGGVARKSRETMLLCEAAGYDIILIETVGVGQSETLVHSMVDCFVVLMLAGAGDELQGIKKGIIELADLLVITKADGDNVARAQRAQAELAQVVRMLNCPTEGWRPKVLLSSSVENKGITDVWATIHDYINAGKQHHWLKEKRQQQNVDWLRALVDEALKQSFRQNPGVEKILPQIAAQVKEGKLPQMLALKQLMEAYRA
ncbi:MAG: methylmalonyl Co-A mutase-associated GTPase MeaB [Verrucomicrobiales bacterium]|jgi:LAO/AO transport system kinase|nr:methylmalonyl Co-A mutase-associated GTPase MeaB [Verrucomicrobiales bacterium]